MKVLQVGPGFACAIEEYEQFCKRHEVVHSNPKQGSRSEVIAEIRKTIQTKGPFEAWYVFNIPGIFKLIISLSYGFHGLAPLGEELLGSALPELKLFTNSGAGTDIIDLPYFTSQNVYVANTPVSISTGDLSRLVTL